MTRTRHSLAAVAAAALIAATLSTTGADAAPPGTHSVGASKPPTTHSARRAPARRPGTRPAGVGPRVVFVVKGTPNGHGPADQTECNHWAGWIDDLGEAEEAALNEDDLEGFSNVEDVRDQAISDAEGRGCQITLS